MKRISALLLCLCLLLGGCGKPIEVSQPTERPAQTVPDQIPEEVPFPEETQEAVKPPPVEELPPAAEPYAETPTEEIPAPQPTCTFTICCQKALEYSGLEANLRQMLPGDGWILPETEILLEGEESVFDVLLRVTRQQGIAMEFTGAEMYGSAYIEGIGYLYEFDCGSRSGWIYTVNGESPNVGCSNYTVQNGDAIVWAYITER